MDHKPSNQYIRERMRIVEQMAQPATSGYMNRTNIDLEKIKSYKPNLDPNICTYGDIDSNDLWVTNGETTIKLDRDAHKK